LSISRVANDVVADGTRIAVSRSDDKLNVGHLGLEQLVGWQASQQSPDDVAELEETLDSAIVLFI
jgi:hypothetical protein